MILPHSGYVREISWHLVLGSHLRNHLLLLWESGSFVPRAVGVVQDGPGQLLTGILGGESLNSEMWFPDPG